MNDRQLINLKSVEAYRDFGDLTKHAARHLLWLPEANELKKQIKRHLRYFTLPGRWAYDIFFLEQNSIIQKQGRGFPDVRFCDFDESSYTEAKKLLGSTIGMKGRFEKLVLESAREFWGGFPYDLYNLDFCGTCFPREEPPFSETFSAIQKIIEEHARCDSFPFSMFLTMKALRSETNKQAQTELMSNIETNRQHQEFTDIINGVIPNTKDFVEHQFPNFLIISIPKIICHISRHFCDVSIQKRAKYRRGSASNQYHIIKFVFRFIKRTNQTLQVMSHSYISNILSIMSLRDVISITRSHGNQKIRQSLFRLKSRVGAE